MGSDTRVTYVIAFKISYSSIRLDRLSVFVICMAVFIYYRPTPRSINSSPRLDSVMVVFSVIHNLDTLQFLRVISMTWLTAVSFSYIYYALFTPCSRFLPKKKKLSVFALFSIYCKSPYYSILCCSCNPIISLKNTPKFFLISKSKNHFLKTVHIHPKFKLDISTDIF